MKPIELIKRILTPITIFSLLSIIIAACTYVFFAEIDNESWGNGSDFSSFGSYIGGVLAPTFSFMALLILIDTLKETKKINEFNTSIFITNFFREEANIHKSLINEQTKTKFNKSVEFIFYEKPGSDEKFSVTADSFDSLKDHRKINIDSQRNKRIISEFTISSLHEKTDNGATTIIRNTRTSLDNLRFCVSQVLHLNIPNHMKLSFLSSYIAEASKVHSYTFLSDAEVAEANSNYIIFQSAILENKLTQQVIESNQYFTIKNSVINPIMIV